MTINPFEITPKHLKNVNTRNPISQPQTRFTAFEDDEDLVINPDFNKSLKESLKQSKRRLMLFIDNNDTGSLDNRHKV